MVGKVHHQVANEHTTNLRDDIDELHEDVSSLAVGLARVESILMGVMEESRQTNRRLDSTTSALRDDLGVLSKSLQVHLNKQQERV